MEYTRLGAVRVKPMSSTAWRKKKSSRVWPKKPLNSYVAIKDIISLPEYKCPFVLLVGWNIKQYRSCSNPSKTQDNS